MMAVISALRFVVVVANETIWWWIGWIRVLRSYDGYCATYSHRPLLAIPVAALLAALGGRCSLRLARVMLSASCDVEV